MDAPKVSFFENMFWYWTAIRTRSNVSESQKKSFINYMFITLPLYTVRCSPLSSSNVNCLLFKSSASFGAFDSMPVILVVNDSQRINPYIPTSRYIPQSSISKQSLVTFLFNPMVSL